MAKLEARDRKHPIQTWPYHGPWMFWHREVNVHTIHIHGQHKPKYAVNPYVNPWRRVYITIVHRLSQSNQEQTNNQGNYLEHRNFMGVILG